MRYWLRETSCFKNPAFVIVSIRIDNFSGNTESA
jgi:hypothetical protein